MTTRGLDRAFPLENPRSTRQLGMTIREYATIHIAAGLIASPMRDPDEVALLTVMTVDRLLAALGDAPEEP